MLEILHDEEGNIKACLEWYLVDKLGNLDDKGEYVWVQEVEINKSARNNGVLKEFTRIIIDKCPQAKYGYFSRRKYNDRVRLYTKRQWLKLLGG